MKLKIFSCTLAMLMLGSVCGCSIGYDGKTGEVVTNMTQLPAPYGVSYNDDTKTVSWSQVDNTSGYYVQINNGTPVGKLQNNYYKLHFDEDCTFTVSVKACGNGILYSDSDWFVAEESFLYTVEEIPDNDGSDDLSSSEDSSYDSTTSEEDSSNDDSVEVTPPETYEEDYEGTGLGRSINYITATSYESMSGGLDIFDMEKLYQLQPKAEAIKSNISTTTSEESIDSFMSSYENSSNQKIGLGIKDLKGISANLAISYNEKYEKKTKAETLQLHYNTRQVITGKRMEIPGYKNTATFSDMLSDKFLSDAKKVNEGTMSPANFINLYGTHVMMAVYYGGAFDATYSAITNNTEDNESWLSKVEASLSASFKKLSGSATSDSESVSLTTVAEKDKITNLNIYALGGADGNSFGSMESFLQDYKAWASSVTEDTYATVDVPDGSLYCVWEYLDDSYQNAKNILNSYLREQCREKYDQTKEKFGAFFIPDDLEYDSETETRTVNLDIYQESGAVGAFNTPDYINGILTSYPATDYQTIQTVKIKGGYGVNNVNGQEITNLINNISFKFDASWKGVHVILENVGLSQDYDQPILDFSAIPSDYTVTIEIVGKNKLDGLMASTNQKQAPIVGNNIVLVGSGDLEVIGATGANGVDYTGANGVDGVAAMIVENLTVNITGSLSVTGGTGGTGGVGIEGSQGGTGYTGNSATDNGGWGNNASNGGTGGIGGTGGTGGTGGMGAPAVYASAVEMINGNATFISGNGGEGGKGGKGGRGGTGGTGGEDDWGGIGTNKPGNGGPGGKGGTGGTGGNGGDCTKAVITLDTKQEVVILNLENVTMLNGSCGAAGLGGDGGDPGSGGAGGSGGSNGSNGDYGADGDDGDPGAPGRIGKNSDGLYVYGEHYYIFVETQCTWEEAKVKCEEMGGHLVTIQDADENEFVRGFVGVNSVWIGANDIDTEGTYVWITGEEFNYTNWASGEPNNSGGIEDYIMIYSSSGLWNDTTATHTAYFVCEIER